MKVLITGACGFVGSTLALAMKQSGEATEIIGLDNFSRPGSEINRPILKAAGIRVLTGDIRNASDLATLPSVDWVIDAAANPSVLAGIDGKSSSRQVVEHNLLGTVNLLEFCRERSAGFILLSTSRVYAAGPLAKIAVRVENHAYEPSEPAAWPSGFTREGVAEGFSTGAPISLYGATKLASEALALEYLYAFDVPVWINRCGVLAGAGQFGRADQGIFAFWINAWLRNHPLKYIGFDGGGHQVRDCLHPRDLVSVLSQQMAFTGGMETDRICNFSGGRENSMSLAQLSNWCGARFGRREIPGTPLPRPYDVPWLVLDSRRAAELWNWKPRTPLKSVLDEIAAHAEANPQWLEASDAR